MSDGTKIQWTDASWNIYRGCSRRSDGCTRCYAETVARRFSGVGQPYEGLINEHGRWNGKVRFIEAHLLDPIRWKRPRRIFVNSMSDLFHESLTDEQIDPVFGIMAAARQHTFQALTKRSERLLLYTRQDRRKQWAAAACAVTTGGDRLYDQIAIGPTALPNVWLGVSVEDQRVAHRVVDLLHADAAVRFVSAEPLIGGVDFTKIVTANGACHTNALTGYFRHSDIEEGLLPTLNWVIAGGESGAGARPCSVDWIRTIIDDCRAQNVACFVKQLGADPKGMTTAGDALRLTDRKGGDPAEWPPGLNVREFPRVDR